MCKTVITKGVPPTDEQLEQFQKKGGYIFKELSSSVDSKQETIFLPDPA